MSNSTGTNAKEQNKNAASSLLRRNVRKPMNNKLALFDLIAVVMIAVACIVGTVIGVDYNTPVLPDMKKSPNDIHLLGTSTIGRDLLARILVGGCCSILIGVFCAVMGSVIEAALGAAAGCFGRKTGAILIRISEMFQVSPQLALVTMLMIIVNKRGPGNLLFIFMLTGWMTTFHMVRNGFMSTKGETYVKVCEAFGISRNNIMFKQILPSMMSPIIVSATTNVAFSILQGAAPSFTGPGVADSTSTQDNTLNAVKSVSVVINQWWIWLFPGLTIGLFILVISFLDDGLKGVLDVRQQ